MPTVKSARCLRRLSIPLLCALVLSAPGLLLPPARRTQARAQLAPERPRSNHETQVKVACHLGLRVNTWNGNLFYPVPLLSIPGRGLPLELSLSYNSSWRDNPSHFGRGMQLSHQMFYTRDEGGNVVVAWGDGRTDRFAKVEGGFLSPADTFDTLAETQPGRYALRSKDGSEFLFDSAVHKRLTALRDPNGNALTFSYDADMRMTALADAAGRRLLLTYSGDRLASITDPNSLPPRAVEFGYDAGGNLTSVTDAEGGVTALAYDAGHMLTRVAPPRGAAAEIAYGADGVVTRVGGGGSAKSFSYDPAGLTTTLTETVSGVERATRFVYDIAGRVARVERGRDGGGSVAQSFVWDEGNNLLSFTDERGRPTRFAYDAHGNLTSRIDALGHTTAYAYERTFNRLTRVTDAAGRTTTYEYDARGNLARETNPLGQILTHGYDAKGDRVSSTDARGNTTAYAYDAFGNVVSVNDPLRNSAASAYDGVGNLVSTTTPGGLTTAKTYDRLNRLTSETNPLGERLSRAYDAAGNLTRTADAENNAHAYAFDPLNRLSAVTDPLGRQTRFSYDEAGNLIAVTDANGRATTFTYDRLNRRLTETNPLGHTTAFAYDDAGNVVSRTDAKGVTTNYSYDALNRLLAVDYPGAGEDLSFAYDAAGNRTQARKSDAAVDYAYDALNRLERVTYTLPGVSKTVAYAYDAAGNRATMTDPDGGVTAYAYDAANRLVRLADPAGNVTLFAYDRDHRLVRRDAANGSVAAYEYDGADRVSKISNRRSDGSVFSSFAYQYDRAGNRTRLTEADGAVTAYGYDRLYQLTSVSYPGGAAQSFAYDAVGNRTSLDDAGALTGYAYDAADRLTRAGATAYEWDANGNLAARVAGAARTAYAHDFENRLVRVEAPGGAATTFAYFPDGTRLSKTAGGQKTVYIPDGENVLVETDAQGATAARYTSGLAADDWLSVARAGVSLFYQHDGLRSITGLSDASQGLVAAYRYDAFGVPTVVAAGAAVNPYRYTGREQDETGLQYYRARYYDPRAGRFITRDTEAGDPLDPLTLNAYTYVRNGPATYVDPSGHFKIKTPKIVKSVGKAVSKAVNKVADAVEKVVDVAQQAVRFAHLAYQTISTVVQWAAIVSSIVALPATAFVLVPAIADNVRRTIEVVKDWEYAAREGKLPPVTARDIAALVGPYVWEKIKGTVMGGGSGLAAGLAGGVSGGAGIVSSGSGGGSTGVGGGLYGAGGCSAVIRNGRAAYFCGISPGGGTAGGGSGGTESKPLNVAPSAFLESPRVAANHARSATHAPSAAAPPAPSAAATTAPPAAAPPASFATAAVATAGGTTVARPAVATAAPLVALRDVLPADGPDGTVGVPAAPSGPLGGSTNAVEAVAVDFVEPGADAPRATVFATKTIENAYEHDYTVCNRFHDYTLETAAAVPLAGVLPGAAGVPKFWYASTTKGALVEETFVFNVFVDEAGRKFTVDSRWLADYYPTPAGPPHDYIFNFQIWAASSEEAYRLLRRTLLNLAGFGPGWSVAFANTAEAPAPAVLVRTAELAGGSIRMTVQSWLAEPRQVSFFGSLRRPSDRTASVNFEHQRTLQPGFNVVELPAGLIIDAVVYVRVNDFLDKVYVGSGFWFPFDDASAGGGSRATVANLDCPPGANLTDRDLPLVGCTRLTGAVGLGGFAGMARTLNPNGRPIDVSRYHALTFFAKGDGQSYRVSLETDAVRAKGSTDFHQFVFTASPEWRQLVIPLSAFAQQGFDATKLAQFAGTDVKTVSFSAVGDPLASVDLAIDRLAFTNSTLIVKTRALPHTTDTVGPYQVTTRATDDVGISSASLLYSLNGSAEFTRVPMSACGGGRGGRRGSLDKTTAAGLCAAIPGQQLGSEVGYYVEVSDADGNVAADPPDAPYAARSFQISARPHALVEDFSDTNPANRRGGRTFLFGRDTGASIAAHYDRESLRLAYDVTAADSFAGYSTSLRRADLAAYNAVSFMVKGSAGGERVKVGLRDGAGNEPKIAVGEYLPAGVTTSWQRATIPFAAFTRVADWAGMESLVIVVEQRIGSGRGEVYFDDIRFEMAAPAAAVVVDNFNEATGENGLGGSLWTADGGAGVSASFDPANRLGASGAGYRIAYTGVTPTAWAAAGFDLLGLDASAYQTLSFHVRGARGDERPNVYLASRAGGVETRRFVDLEQYARPTADWQRVEIPLADFAAKGVDLSDLAYVQFVFEFEHMAGTIFLDDITIRPAGDGLAADPALYLRRRAADAPDGRISGGVPNSRLGLRPPHARKEELTPARR